jgi:hypothetical protein
MTTRIFKIKVVEVDCERLYYLARKRRVSAETLLGRLVQIVLREDLIAAVLDDSDLVAKEEEREYKSSGIRPEDAGAFASMDGKK